MALDTTRPWVVHLDVQQAVRRMVRDALDYAADKLPHSSADDVAGRMQRADCSACSYVHHALARSLAAYLGASTPGIQGIYVYEPEHATGEEFGRARPPNAPVISLLVWVQQKHEALEELGDDVRAAAARHLRQLPCTNRAPGECTAIDVQWVDNEDVARRRGYGALISSRFTRPIRLWPV